MTCIKTGAYVSIPDYNLFAPADIYQVGDVFIFRFNVNPCQFDSYNAQRKVTHTLAVNFAGDNFIRFDLGFVVVEARAVTTNPETNT